MERKVIITIFLTLGILCRGLASFYRFLITSDIPVSYSAAEALIAQIIFFISSIFFLFALSMFQSNKGYIIAGGLFALMVVLDITIFNIHVDTEYYNSSFAQLQIASLLNSSLIMIYSFFLLIKSGIENSVY